MLTPASVSQNEEFKQHMASLSVPVLRIVNRRDLVPQIPGAPQLGDVLCCTLMCIVGCARPTSASHVHAGTTGLLQLFGTTLALQLNYDPEASFAGRAYTWLTTPILRTFFPRCAAIHVMV